MLRSYRREGGRDSSNDLQDGLFAVLGISISILVETGNDIPRTIAFQGFCKVS
jgi:hypothetical protein